ncbi:hypothetical protein PYDG_00034 [Pseudoalteromonas phage pYD6-A]|uniref:Uncharacterized protein n=1 Tax=Pseudoalteromonas phage pYD6-A TaxID=754052 RepID=M4SRY4_9CAUD|nr:hypothetical protein PYDG_00034 [Pseudoalteromonas phage pYD6-A]AGH57566.1 hypothetical protein PYDG_00034 [Pseudoalteromonas phage pYD6-A]
MDKRNKALLTNILIDIGFLYPLMYFAIIAESTLAIFLIAALNLVFGITAIVTACVLKLYYKESVNKGTYNMNAFHWVYMLSSTTVELGIFIYMGWIGMAAMWAIALGSAIYYLFKGD